MQLYPISAEIEPIYQNIITSKPFEKLTEYAQTSLTHYLVPLWPFDEHRALPGYNISYVNRKKHSKSTYQIVKKFFEFHPELKEDDCEIRAKVAAFCHDIGVPAASHYNEYNLQYLINVKDHEHRARKIMQETEIRDPITELCTIDEVAKMIEGIDTGVGCIVNNGNHPTPDADSIHNLIMYLMAYVNMNGNRLPDPTKLIKHMKIENGVLLMEKDAEPEEFDAYKRCRKIMYDEIHGAWHTSAASILTYSLGHTLAEKGKETLIDDGFLDFGDKELIMYLKNDPLLNELISRTQKGILPVCIAEAETSMPSEYLMRLHRDLLERSRYSNDIAERLGGNFKLGDITVEVSKLKSEKGMGDRYNIRAFVNAHRERDFNVSKKNVIDFEEFGVLA